MKAILLLIFLTGCSKEQYMIVLENPCHQCLTMCEGNRSSEYADSFYRIMKSTEQKCYAECNHSFCGVN